MKNKKELQQRIKILQRLTYIMFGVLLIALIRVVFFL